MPPPKLPKTAVHATPVRLITQRRIDALCAYWGIPTGEVLDECVRRVYQRERRKIRAGGKPVVDRHHEDERARS